MDLQNIHKGKRCFIIGCGPSIDDMDITWLKDEITIGVNHSFVITQDNGFDSTYTCTSNEIAFKKWKDEYAELDTKCVFTEHLDTKNYKGDNIVKIVPLMKNKNGTEPNVWGGNYSHYLDKGIYRRSATVTISLAIPLAMYLGCNPIILIGCDCTALKHNTDNKIGYAKQEERTANRLNLPKVLKSYDVVHKYMEGKGFYILNASGGDLETFPRVRLEDIKKS